MNQDEVRASIKAERLLITAQDPSMDIVQRLRERAGQNDECDWHGAIELEAAAEIERLRGSGKWNELNADFPEVAAALLERLAPLDARIAKVESVIEAMQITGAAPTHNEAVKARAA